MQLDLEESGAGELINVDFGGARFRNVNFAGAKVMEAMLVGARFSGLITGLVINDIEVAPLIEAEMNRRYPERARLRPLHADGVREAWAIIERQWSATRSRAEGIPEAALHQRVDGEWSFLETARHLIHVTDSWVGTNILGRVGHHHPFGVPPSFVTDTSHLGLDPAADPSLAEVIAVREDRMATVRELIADITDEQLAESRGNNTVLSCLHTLLDEEWHHLWYANRDLDTITTPHAEE